METSLVPQETITPTEEIVEETTEINLYPIIRHIFLTLCILLALTIILFLMYQNGKSIYDKGI